MVLRFNSRRRGISGIETAIIITAFVITASAFSFVILNVGFLTSDKAQTTVITGMKETSSSLLADAGVTGYFSNTTTTKQDEVYLEEMIFYIKLVQDTSQSTVETIPLLLLTQTSEDTQ
jgi:flagellin-like protein